jgi:hypothetical protein
MRSTFFFIFLSASHSASRSRLKKKLFGHFQELAGVPSSESLQFLQFSLYILLGLAMKSVINHPLILSSFRVKRGVQVEGHLQMLIKLAGTLIWSLEDFWCFVHAHGLFLSFLHAS